MNIDLNNLKNEGGIYIKENFFTKEQFDKINNNFSKKTFYEHHQPEKYECGNRFKLIHVINQMIQMMFH